MNHPKHLQPKPAVIARVVHVPRRRGAGRNSDTAGKRKFKTGDVVRSRTRVFNDGIYPHRDIGEILVDGGDIGAIRESWTFLGEIYYTVDFYARAAIVIMRGHEVSKAGAHRMVRPLR